MISERAVWVSLQKRALVDIHEKHLRARSVKQVRKKKKESKCRNWLSVCQVHGSGLAVITLNLVRLTSRET